LPGTGTKGYQAPVAIASLSQQIANLVSVSRLNSPLWMNFVHDET
jgi:hypothetical protein